MRTFFAPLVGAASAAVVLAAMILPTDAHHTIFSFQVDRFEGDGNAFGPSDGVIDFVDEFDDGTLSPNWYHTIYGTVFESGGFLYITNPGTHLPAPDGTTLDVSVAAGSSQNFMTEGGGNFTGIAYWEPIIPDVGHHYHLSLFTFGGGDYFNETFAIAIRRTDTALEIGQFVTELDLTHGIYQQTMLEFVPISADDVTGQIVFRIDFDDATNLATSSFSLDGGTTWQSPFPAAEIFVGRTTAQFLLSADPEADSGGGTTTTTTASSSTTTTTLLPQQQTTAGKLLLVKDPKAGDASRRRILYRVKERESTNAVVGNPIARGATLKITLDGNTDCYDMPASGWSAISTLGFKYRDPRGVHGPVKVAAIKQTPSGTFLIKAKVVGRHGPITVVPPDPGTQADTNFRLGGGDEYCSTFGGTIEPNNARTFKAKNAEAPAQCNVTACSPSGAFLDPTGSVLD